MNTVTMPSALHAPQQPAVSLLQERAMLVSLRLSAWLGQRLDRKTTADVLSERGAEPDAGKFEKYLVPKSALEPINKAHTAARTRFYAMTLPWGDDSSRLLSAANYIDFSSAMLEERGKCEAAYEQFFQAYPGLVAQAAQRLGPQLFRAGDFPSPGAIRLKFGFTLTVMPVPAKEDFRVDLGAELQEQLRRDIERTVSDRFVEAHKEVWTRVLDTLRHFASTMAQENKIFRDSTVFKLAELARLAPKLAVKPDPALEQVCHDIVKLTSSVTPSDLRENPALRASAADRAHATLRAIEDQLAGAFL